MRNQDPTAANRPQIASTNGLGRGPSAASRPEIAPSGAQRRRRERSRRKDGPTLGSVREDYVVLLNFYAFGTGQRLAILQGMREAGSRLALDRGIARAIDEAIRREGALSEREAEWANRERSLYEKDAREAASRLERSVSTLYQTLVLNSENFPSEHAYSQAADRLRKALFPGGVIAITNQVFTVEHASVGLLLEHTAREKNARDLETLSLQAQIQYLRELHEAFGAAIKLTDPPDFAELQQSRREGQHQLAVIIARVIGVHWGSDPEDVTIREELMRPVVFHNQRVRQSRRRRPQASSEAFDDPDADFNERDAP